MCVMHAFRWAETARRVRLAPVMHARDWLPRGQFAWSSHPPSCPSRPLYEAAVARLRREGRQLGWGAHVGGTVDWDGASDAFAQLVDPRAMVLKDLGTFDSMAEVRVGRGAGQGPGCFAALEHARSTASLPALFALD